MEINVLGLGESLIEYKANECATIGVNDIFKHHRVDYLVCVDNISAFDRERFRTILNSRPKKFFTQLDCWRPLMQNYQLIKFAKGNGELKEIDNKEFVCYSNNSTFVACVIAYKIGAKKINLYGADFNTHPNFRDLKLKKTLKDFENLNKIFVSKGVDFRVTKQSKLSEFIKTI